MSTIPILQTLLGIVNSRSNKTRPGMNPASAPAADPFNSPTPPGQLNAPATPQPDPFQPATPQQQPQPQPATNQPQPQTTLQTEQNLRDQLNQADLYDLSGEKAAAEALKKEDAFKQQDLEQKAQQTKDFFAQQDQKQQETLKEVQQQADQQLQEKQQKEFWDQKQSQEMQAGMDKELMGLHQAAQQAHQEWRSDFTEGVCRDDVAALYNKDITNCTDAYKERLDDIGTNSVDSAETIAKYKVKLQDEVAPQIDQKTAELHQEHFPEHQPGSHVDGHVPDGHGPDSHGPEPPPESHWPEEHEEEEHPDPAKKSGPGIGGPAGGNNADMPGYGGRHSTDSSPGYGGGGNGGSGGGDGTPPEGEPKATQPQHNNDPGADDAADEAAYSALKYRQKMDDEAAQKEEWAQEAKADAFNDRVLLAGDVADSVAGHVMGAEDGLGLPGLPDDVAGQAVGWTKIAYDHGIPGLEASAQIYMDKAQDVFEAAKEHAAGLSEKAQELGQQAMDKAQEFGTKAEAAMDSFRAGSSGEAAEAAGVSHNELGRGEAAEAAQPDSASGPNPNLRGDYEQRLKDMGQDVNAGMQKFDTQNAEANKPAPEVKPDAPAPQQQSPQTPAPSLSSSFNSVA